MLAALVCLRHNSATSRLLAPLAGKLARGIRRALVARDSGMERLASVRPRPSLADVVVSRPNECALSLSLSLSHSLTPSLSHSLSLSLSLSLSHSLTLPLTLRISLFLSLSLRISLSLYVSLSLSISPLSVPTQGVFADCFRTDLASPQQNTKPRLHQCPKLQPVMHQCVSAMNHRGDTTS